MYMNEKQPSPSKWFAIIAGRVLSVWRDQGRWYAGSAEEYVIISEPVVLFETEELARAIASRAASKIDDGEGLMVEEATFARPRLVLLSLDAFAARVQAVADVAELGVHEGGVFVNLLHRLLEPRAEASGLDLATFKARLLKAHRVGLLELDECREPVDSSGYLADAEIVDGARKYYLLRRTPAEI
jgi:hypothetical protein